MLGAAFVYYGFLLFYCGMSDECFILGESGSCGAPVEGGAGTSSNESQNLWAFGFWIFDSR